MILFGEKEELWELRFRTGNDSMTFETYNKLNTYSGKKTFSLPFMVPGAFLTCNKLTDKSYRLLITLCFYERNERPSAQEICFLTNLSYNELEICLEELIELDLVRYKRTDKLLQIIEPKVPSVEGTVWECQEEYFSIF